MALSSDVKPTLFLGQQVLQFQQVDRSTPIFHSVPRLTGIALRRREIQKQQYQTAAPTRRPSA
jgi:hypothetical protein